MYIPFECWTPVAMLQTAMDHTIYLTDTIFETGAYGVPSKSQNPTVLGQGGLPSNQW